MIHMSDATVTFIITNYNYGAFINKAIESIALQNGIFHKEVLIVDDFSSDFPQEYLKNIETIYGNHFASLRILYNSLNCGKIHCINRVVPLISGQYFIILDADDYLHPNYLVATHNAYLLQKKINSMIGFVYSNCFLVDVNDKFIGYGKSTKFDSGLVTKFSYIPDNALTETRLIKEIFPMDETIRTATKHHKWKEICKNKWVGFHLNKNLFYYRMHSKNMSEIGAKILSSEDSPAKDNLLSGYWPTSL